MIFKDENINEDVGHLEEIPLIPPTKLMANSQVDDQIFTGDQPTVERAINVIASVANGFTRHRSSDWRLVCSCKASLGSNFRQHLN